MKCIFISPSYELLLFINVDNFHNHMFASKYAKHDIRPKIKKMILLQNLR